MFGIDDAIMGGLVSGGLGFLGQESTNEANSAQSQAQMDFQREMSNTAYQRATADMKAAGLNPMLAYSQGGASSPGGAQAVMGNSTQAGVAAAQQAASTDLTRATTAKTEAETVNTKAEAEARILELTQRAKTSFSSSKQIDETAQRLRDANSDSIGFSDAALQRQKAAREGWLQDIDYERYKAGAGKADVDYVKTNTRMRAAQALSQELDIPEHRAGSNYWNEVGKGGVYFREGSQGLSRISNSAASLGLKLNPVTRRFAR